jgi:cell division control protein 6
VARYFKENEEVYASITEIEKAYAVICEEYGEEPNSHTQIWNYTQYLSKLGVLKTEVANAETRGRTTRVSLPTIPASELEKQLSDSLASQRRGT